MKPRPPHLSFVIRHLSFATALLSLAATTRADTPAPTPDGRPHTLALTRQQFQLDGKPFRIIAGEMDPGRIPPEMWDDRLKKAKAMGLNTIAPYLYWNQIEPTEGKFVFQGSTDVRRFVQLCQKNGLWVALRPGPYVCAEIEFGGFPAWLLKHHDMKIRADDPQFLAYSQKYVEALAKQVADLQVNHGGPILMTQFENEYSHIDTYLAKLHDIFVHAGFDGQLMICDHSGKGPTDVWKQKDFFPNVLRGYNGLQAIVADRIDQARAVNGDMPFYSPEVYTGWFDLWGGKLITVPVKKQVSDTEFFLSKPDISWCYYVFDGGTNFGFSAGSNAGRPMQTTYDYDAPVDELGRITPKYKALRDVIAKAEGLNLPPIPPDPRIITIPAFNLQPSLPLLEQAYAAKPIASPDVKPMEDLDQNYGFILYRKKLTSAAKGTLTLPAARDYVFVMIDGKVVADGLTDPKKPTFTANIDARAGSTLDILVENMGRTSSPFDQKNSRKGLEGNPTLGSAALTDWQIVPLPLDTGEAPTTHTGPVGIPTGPSFFTGSFRLPATGETYLNLQNWSFGIVWVNGHNLGRFWNVGSSRSLYLPSSWQKVGANQITILELGPAPKIPQVAGEAQMAVDPVQPFTPLWSTGPAQTLKHVEGQGDEGNGLQ